MIKPRDFIETREGLIFASISEGVAFLRYFPSSDGGRKRGKTRYKKVSSTKSSFDFLERNYPSYIFRRKGYRLQGCQKDRILEVYSPVEKLKELGSSGTYLQKKCVELSDALDGIPERKKGVTGSILVDLCTPSSDIDFVLYGKRYFDSAREIIRESPDVTALRTGDWRFCYQKRFGDKPALEFESYVWQEKRKFNSGLFKGTFFNLLLVENKTKLKEATPVKRVKIRCRVRDAGDAFNLPSVYLVDHDLIGSVVCYTHTYSGQAIDGEMIEVSGMLEKTEDGEYRLLVGTSREAEGEYIRVIGS
jgi:predicted nucleotidyltransferase